MRFLLNLLTISLLSAIPTHAAVTSTHDWRKALTTLKQTLAREDYYVNARQASIDSVCSELAATTEPARRLVMIDDIARRYYDFQADSALVYFRLGIDEARAAGDSVRVQRFTLGEMSVLPLSGAVREAVQTFEAIKYDDVYPENRYDYFTEASRMFYFIIPYYTDKQLATGYFKRAFEMSDSVIRYAIPASSEHLYYTAIRSFMSGSDRVGAVANLAEALDAMPVTDPYYARMAIVLSYYYYGIEQEDESIYYLVQAALSDALLGRREETALLKLGEELYKQGEVDLAYQFLTRSANNAARSGAAQRTLEAARSLPIIADAQTSREHHKTQFMFLLAVAFALALAAIIVVMLRLRRERNSLQAMRQSLLQSNAVKDTFIREFLNMAWARIESFDSFSKMLIRKLKASQNADVLKILSSGQFRNEQTRVYYELYDQAFMNIYPTFFQDVNKLFAADKQISVPEPDTPLTTEQRILASMRMGFEDSQRMASFLGVSVNTIYTYRNRFRAAAISRDTFEEDILRLDLP